MATVRGKFRAVNLSHGIAEDATMARPFAHCYVDHYARGHGFIRLLYGDFSEAAATAAFRAGRRETGAAQENPTTFGACFYLSCLGLSFYAWSGFSRRKGREKICF
jgi:hypothetical protein